MKKIALVLTGAFLSMSTMSAMATSNSNVVIESKYFDGQKTKVERNDLPQEVINSLEESEYQNWEIKEAYRVEDDQTNEVHYELHLASYTASDKVRNVTFNESGEIISDEQSELGRTEDQGFEQPATEPGFEGTEHGIDQGTEPGMEGTDPGLDGTDQGTEPGSDGTEQGTEGQQY